MIIKRFEIVDLLGNPGVISSSLNNDLNIITGRNGSGKTTVLKLLWYLISGNIERARSEIRFTSALIETSFYTLIATRVSDSETKIELTYQGRHRVFEDSRDEDDDIVFDAEDAANDIVEEIGGSIFFPTFRRIEGGFSTDYASPHPFLTNALGRAQKGKGEIEEALANTAKRLSNAHHRFVSSISTADIADLLIKQYTDMTETSSNFQRKVSQEVIDDIKAFERKSEPGGPTAEEVLEMVKGKIESIDADRQRVFAPFDAIQKTVVKVFQHSGISVNSRISFGDAAKSVNSASLSAGEKQLLSFICYNAFYRDSVFFIDEPELSLHVDWQRTLFPILKEQGTNNQFIVATHSPFIYSKYPDKEINLNPDRGDI